MRHKLGYSVLTALLLVSIYLNLRDRHLGLELLQTDGEMALYKHVDSSGLTEMVKDVDGDGIYEYHDYTISLSEGREFSFMIWNEDERAVPAHVAMTFVDRQGKQDFKVGFKDVDEDGVYHACIISSSDVRGGDKSRYEDWDFDGRFEFSVVGEEQPSKYVLYDDQWLSVLLDRPYEIPKFVTVMLDGRETKLEFRNGEFHTAIESE